VSFPVEWLFLIFDQHCLFPIANSCGFQRPVSKRPTPVYVSRFWKCLRVAFLVLVNHVFSTFEQPLDLLLGRFRSGKLDLLRGNTPFLVFGCPLCERAPLSSPPPFSGLYFPDEVFFLGSYSLGRIKEKCFPPLFLACEQLALFSTSFFGWPLDNPCFPAVLFRSFGAHCLNGDGFLCKEDFPVVSGLHGDPFFGHFRPPTPCPFSSGT